MADSLSVTRARLLAALGAVDGSMLRDEQRHAELAWRTVRWAMEQSGEEVRQAVAAAFEQPVRLPSGHPLPLGLEGHGLLPGSRIREALHRGIRMVVRPCARVLLAA